jgi:hypothetical protein
MNCAPQVIATSWSFKQIQNALLFNDATEKELKKTLSICLDIRFTQGGIFRLPFGDFPQAVSCLCVPNLEYAQQSFFEPEITENLIYMYIKHYRIDLLVWGRRRSKTL